MGILFRVAPGEQCNTENIVICALLAIDTQDIEIEEVQNLKVKFKNLTTGEKGEIEAGPVGVHGMNHGERMDAFNQIIAEMFQVRSRKPFAPKPPPGFKKMSLDELQNQLDKEREEINEKTNGNDS